MQTVLWVIGKTNNNWLSQMLDDYKKRIQKYQRFEILIIPDLKNKVNLSRSVQKKKEGELVMDRLNESDYLIVLDKDGTQMDSLLFSKFISMKRMGSQKRLIFLIGGAYGVDESVYKRANEKISFSKMTFSHQMIRLFFLEQLYRANSILKNEPYHN